jgi:hypothetical protein
VTRWVLFTLSLAACHHDETRATGVTAPSASAASEATPVAFDVETHLKNGARARAGDVTFTVRLLPKLIVSGPQPEIEQAQIEVARGADHAVLQVDTRNKRAEWGGVVFELGYADVYHDDIELTVHKK